ncbi:hypothetical protein VTK56DRAFT_8966 [Thermocarpiscus australiensis]
MASAGDDGFGIAPKKKVTTYGKAARRRAQGPRPGILRHTESAPEIPTSFARSPSRSPEPPRLSTRAASSSKVWQQRVYKRDSDVRRKPVEESHSQPLPELPGIESIEYHKDEVKRIKKRRLGRECMRECFEEERAIRPYTTPDSSPSGPRSPAPIIEGEISRSAPKVSPSSTSRASTPEKDTDVKGSVTSMPFSAKTSRAFRNLSVSSRDGGTRKQQIPIRLSGKTPSSEPVPKKPSGPITSATLSETQYRTALPRKRRLIDALAAQAEEESSSEGEASSQESEATNTVSPPAFQGSSSPPTPAANRPKTIARPILAAKKTGPKFTYSQQRTMLADDDLVLGGTGCGDVGDGPTGGSLFSFGRLTKSSTIGRFSYLDEDDETVNTGAVRSIHELRQAGANSRFADEMDDILDRIGSPSAKPSSLRRGALLELAQKMKHKDFRQQFRNHSDGGSLFRCLGEETDLVSGYSILATVTTLLAATTSAHLIQELRSQGLATLISRLLEQTTDIVQLAKDRKQNVSRNGQTTLGTIKASLLELPVWEPFSPTALSPRTLALKCLDLLMRQPTHASAEEEVFSEAVTARLFSILSDGVSDSACWEFPNQQESCDFYLALYVLEGHSINAMQSSLNSIWTKQYAPIVADILETALERPTDKFDDLESLTLRISLNVTNHNGEASSLFVGKGLLGRLAKSACDAFDMVMSSMKGDSFLSKVLESLIMMLGAMINFCVYYPPASGSLEGKANGTASSLNRLIRVFADNYSKTADANSMEETQLNVALGYLSILLGYLCLRESIRDRFVRTHPKKNIQPLLDSINEFIAFHHKVAEAQGGEDSKQDSESAALTRLHSLVDQLAAQGRSIRP